MSKTVDTTDSLYFVPGPSHWPIVAVLGVFTLLLGVVFKVNNIGISDPVLICGLFMVFYLMYGWFSEVVTENLTGSYNGQVSQSFRQGMIWFITSEASFFVTFFGCLFYFRAITLPYLGGEGQLGSTGEFLWPDFNYVWPVLELPDATHYTVPKEAMGPWGIPFLNTIILLSSGGTLTWAHWGLKEGNKKKLVNGLAATVALGLTFFGFQVYEYYHAYHAMDLTLNSGIYGSTFYMLTGFHGFHVTIGTIMLIVILVRSQKDHFTDENHFAFEAVAWYWHFVDVVWIALFIFVYWL